MADSFFEFRPIGSHTTNASISSAVTISKPAGGAPKILMQACDQNVRFTLDGTAPTTTTGFLLGADDPPVLLYIGDSVTLKVIEETATASFEYQWGY